MAGDINIYPNPSNGVFTMVTKKEVLRAMSNIEVYNVLGEKVYSQFISSNSQFTLDLSSQPNGIYLYRIMGDSGEPVGEGKLVIQK